MRMLDLNGVIFWIEFCLKGAFTCFLIIMGLIFLRKGFAEKELESKRYFKLGIAMLAIMFSLTRIFFLVTDLIVEKIITTQAYYDLFWRMATISSFFALIFIAIVLETYMVKSKYIFTGIATIGTILLFFVSIEFARSILMPLLYVIIGGEIFLLYLYIAIKSPGDLRKRALLMVLSLLIFTFGITLDTQIVKDIFVNLGLFDPGVIAVIFMWAGLGIYLKLNY